MKPLLQRCLIPRSCQALALCLLLAAPAWAEMRMTVAQLTQFIQSSLKLKQPDKQVAGYLQQVKLTEKLDERSVEELQGLGIGKRTLSILRELSTASAGMTPPLPPATPTRTVIAALVAPSQEEQDRVLKEAREYALQYVKNLPDFLCTQVTRRYADPSGMEFWQARDVVVAKLSYNEQKEDYKVVLVNNQPVDLKLEQVGGTTSRGEFGSMLKEVFEPESAATFQWERWATLRGKRMHVYSYRVPQDKSKLTISYERNPSTTITAGYRGLIYVDRDTSVIMRMTTDAEDIPSSFPIQQALTVLDYEFTDVGGQQFILPLKAVVRLRSGRVLERNDVEFRMYRKFGSDINITFTPEALSDDQTKETTPQP